MIQGFCDPRFAAVAASFEENFAARGEVGASVCVTFKGEIVLDLWGGWAEPEKKRPWEHDTMSVVWSCTKGAVALCAHMLVDRGQLDLAAPVAHYWPEFAAQEKGQITVAMLLSHQAGLAALREPIPADGFCDWQAVVDALAAQKPLWQPGSRHGYHALTFGHLVGELVYRASGRSLVQFLREEIVLPLGVDFFIGLPAELETRVAPLIPPPPPDPRALSPFLKQALGDPDSLAYMVAMHAGDLLLPGAIDRPEVHAAVIPAANGISNARGLAGLYRPLALGGSYGGQRLLSREALLRMSSVEVAGLDATLQVPTRFALGFVKAMDNRHRAPGERDSLILSEEAFGHTGNGGSVGFADPGAGLSFAYTMNQMGTGIALNPRGQSLIDATYRSIGYRQSERGGLWYS